MKLDKQLKKEYIKQIQKKAKESGYKAPQHMFYRVQDDILLYATFTITTYDDLVYSLKAKKMSFDNIFWVIMDMEDNMKSGNTLRVNGAFTSPGAFISKGKIHLTEDIDGIVNSFVDNATKEFTNFMENHDIIDYIFSYEQEYYSLAILRCITYIDIGQIDKAVELAKEHVEKGDRGKYVNGNKGFFERVLLKYA